MTNAHLIEIWAEYADRLQVHEIEQRFDSGYRYVQFLPWYLDLLYRQDGSRWK